MKVKIYDLLFKDGLTLSASEPEKIIANYEPSRPRYYYDPEDIHNPVMLRLDLLHKGEIHTVDLDLKDPDLSAQITRQVPTCRVVHTSMRKNLEACILDMGECYTKDRPRFYLTEHGLRRTEDGAWFYVLGNEILSPPSGVEIVLSKELMKQQLDWDPEIPVQEAVVKHYQRLCHQPSVYFPIWGYTIASFLRSAIEQVEVDMTTFPVCAVTGGQNLGKTTVVRSIMLPYRNRSVPGLPWGELDANGTEAAAREVLCRSRDQVILLDDMTANASASEVSHRKALVRTALRFAANGSVRSKMGAASGTIDQHCQAGMVFTGEYPLMEPSEITRLIWIVIDKPMTGGSPRDRIMAATTLRYFLLWLLPQLDSRLERLQQVLLELPEGSQPRLHKNYALIRWTMETFFCFVYEAANIPLGEIQQAMGYLMAILPQMMDRQIQLAAAGTTPSPKGNICWYILTGYRKGDFRLVKNRKKMKSDQDCVVEDTYLLIRYRTLLNYLHEKNPSCTLTHTALGRHLQANLVISPKKEERYAAKRINGKRYLALDLEALRRAAVAF